MPAFRANCRGFRLTAFASRKNWQAVQRGPDRTSDNWDNFVKRHAKTLRAVDFFSVKAVTAKVLQDMYVLFCHFQNKSRNVSDIDREENHAVFGINAGWAASNQQNSSRRLTCSLK